MSELMKWDGKKIKKIVEKKNDVHYKESEYEYFSF